MTEEEEKKNSSPFNFTGGFILHGASTAVTSVVFYTSLTKLKAKVNRLIESHDPAKILILLTFTCRLQKSLIFSFTFASSETLL